MPKEICYQNIKKQILILQDEVEVTENLRKFLHHLIYRPNNMQAEDHQEPKQERK